MSLEFTRVEHAVVENFFTEVMALADKRGLLRKEHFLVDGMLPQACEAVTRASCPKMAAAAMPTGVAAGATPKPTGRASRAATTRMRVSPFGRPAVQEEP